MPPSDRKSAELASRMQALGVREDDLREHFVRSSGKGGQNVNKVSTCVALKHLPSGLEVKCQQERSQAQNRFLARRLLCDKLERLLLGRESAAEQRVWRLRKQKRRRSRRAKEKVLEHKHRRSEKKESRRKVARRQEE